MFSVLDLHIKNKLLLNEYLVIFMISSVYFLKSGKWIFLDTPTH